ncbi:hypothetical protein EBV26_16300 [bacterium]|nr:hypothetical protein [bacterium]
MGNSLSLSGSKEITGEQLQLSSKEISIMSNELFKFMYSTWKPKDVWDIAEHPDKYVIAISDMITTQFHVLGYKTKDKRMGEIYFRKWDDLEPPMGSDTDLSAANARNDKSLTNIRDEVVARKLKKEISDRKKTRRTRAQAGFPIQKQNAEIIAFYFVRIFQILGAMLLVVKDIELPAYDKQTGEPVSSSRVNETREFARQLYPSQVGISGFKTPMSIDDRKKLEYAEAALRLSKEKRDSAVSVTTQTNSIAKPLVNKGTQAGGGNFDIKLALGPYEFLRYYLRKINDNDRLDFKNNGISDPGQNVYMFDKSRLLFFKYNRAPAEADKIDLKNGVEQEIGLPVKENGKVEIKFITITVTKLTFSLKTGSIVNELRGYIAPSGRGDSKKEVFPTDITISYEKQSREKPSTVTMKRIDTSSSLEIGIPYQIYEADNNLLDAYRGRLDPKDDFIEFLEMITLAYLRRKYNGITLLQLKTKSEAGEDESEGSSLEGSSKFSLKEPSNKSLKDVFSAMNKKEEYRPHCVARALQLLDSASLSNNFANGYGSSRICMTSLGKAVGQTNLSEYIPTKSLGQLYGKVNPTDYMNSMKVLAAFVQKSSTGAPVSLDDVSNFPGEKDDLLAAIQRLTKAFNIIYSDQKGFADIKNDIPVECTTEKGKELKIDRASQEFRDMKSASQQLLAYHLKSIIEISKFLKKIFNISQRGDGSWAVEGPKIELLFAGYETLDMLTNQARAILIDYYAGCEEIYQRGLTKWKDTRKTAADASKAKAPVVAAVIPSATSVVPADIKVTQADQSVKPILKNAGV